MGEFEQSNYQLQALLEKLPSFMFMIFSKCVQFHSKPDLLHTICVQIADNVHISLS